MKKFIVPTDFSPSADHALEYAVMLAAKMKAEVILMHATELFEYRFADKKGVISEYNQMIINNADSELYRRKLAMRKKYTFEIKTCLYNGGIVESVIEAAANHGAALIIMGSLGRTGLKRKLFGSKAVATIAKSVVPVLLVPAGSRIQEPRQIAIALGAAGEELNVLDSVLSIAKTFSCKTAVTVYTHPADEAVVFMEHARTSAAIKEHFARKYGNTDVTTEHVGGADLNEALQQYICNNNVDLLAMVTRKRSLLEGIIDRSRTRSMAYCATVPLLAIPSDAASQPLEEEEKLNEASFYSELYEKCGFLFYAIAAADQHIKEREVEAVNAIVSSRWKHLEGSVDEFGTDKATQIISVFDWLREENRSADECFNIFEDFVKARGNELSPRLKAMISETANSIAFSFRGYNENESVYLQRLRKILTAEKTVINS